MYRGVSLRVDMSRCPRTYGGRRPGRADGRCAPSALPRTATDRVRGVLILASRAALSRALAQGRECRGCRCVRRVAGGLRSDLLPGVAPGRVDGFPGIRGHGRPRATGVVWPSGAVRESWRHRMRLPFRGRGPLWRAPRCAWRMDGHAGSARLRLPGRATPMYLRTALRVPGTPDVLHDAERTGCAGLISYRAHGTWETGWAAGPGSAGAICAVRAAAWNGRQQPDPRSYSDKGGGQRLRNPRIMRSTASCTERSSCTDSTGHRTDGTSCAGIMRSVVPRNVPRGRREIGPEL